MPLRLGKYSFALAAFLVIASGYSFCLCPLKETAVDATQPIPTIDPVTVGDKYLTGKALDKSGTPGVGRVEVCLNGVTPAGGPQQVGANGAYSAPAPALTQSWDVAAQFISDAAGNPRSAVQHTTVSAIGCSKGLVAGSPSTLVLTITPSGSFSGTVPTATKGNITICRNDQPVAAPAGIAPVGSDGSFSGSGLKLNAGETYSAEYSPGAVAGSPYINSSVEVPVSQAPLVIGKQGPLTFDPVAPFGMAVAGLDISGASSTAPQAVFLGTGIMDIPVIGQSLHNQNGPTDFSYRNTWWFSGLLRIAGMAQPGTLSGNLGDLASTGTYLSSALNATPDKIVQSVEGDASVAFQFGSWQPQISSFDVGTFVATANRPKATTLFTLSAIASIGAITPLSAPQANPPVYYLTQQIMSQYNLNPPGCTYTNSTPPCYVSFVPTDRTHFYRNYALGFRLKMYPGDYSDAQPKYRFPGVADVTVGQNEYVTGGRLHSAVLHIGGSMPIPAADGIYIFGSMDLGLDFKYNQENPQLLLTPVPSTANITYLSSTVNAISVSQPNRDRYRFGFGVDIFHLYAAFKAKTAKTATP